MNESLSTLLIEGSLKAKADLSLVLKNGTLEEKIECFKILIWEFGHKKRAGLKKNECFDLMTNEPDEIKKLTNNLNFKLSALQRKKVFEDVTLLEAWVVKDGFKVSKDEMMLFWPTLKKQTAVSFLGRQDVDIPAEFLAQWAEEEKDMDKLFAIISRKEMLINDRWGAWLKGQDGDFVYLACLKEIRPAQEKMEKVVRELWWKKRWISKAILNHDFFIPEEETVRHLLEMGNNEIAFICERNEVKWVNKRSALALKAMFGVETEGKTRTAL